jgi:uncharacterized protein YndB with AHSA1/START domain
MEQAKLDERPSIVLTRRYPVAPEKVWRAWTDAQALKAWFKPGPQGFGVLLAEADARVGGRYRILMKAPDGEEHDVSGVYREVVPNRKLVFTWAWKTTPERESLVTLTFRAVGGGTELELKHEQFFDAEARDRQEHGRNGCLDTLTTYLG